MSRHQGERLHCSITTSPAFLGVVALSPVVFRVQVRVAALQNLVKIMSLYYQYMETYMGPALFAVS